MPSLPLRYSRLQVALHWAIVLLLAGQYATSGAIVRTHEAAMMGDKPNPTELFLHMVHNRAGLLTMAIMAARLALRLWAGVPDALEGGPRWAAGAARAAHLLFYVVIIAQGLTGAIATYLWWPISAVHVILFKLLAVLVGVHVAAALWHQFYLRDGAFRRISGF